MSCYPPRILPFLLSLWVYPLASLSANALEEEMFVVTQGDKTVFAANPETFVSAGLHEYIVHPYRVLELSVAFSGEGNRLRIYAMEALNPEELANNPNEHLQAAQDRGARSARQAVDPGSSVSTPRDVVKNYPQTTHAGTVEFLLPAFSDVEDAHETLINAFERQDTILEALAEVEINLPR